MFWDHRAAAKFRLRRVYYRPLIIALPGLLKRDGRSNNFGNGGKRIRCCDWLTASPADYWASGVIQSWICPLSNPELKPFGALMSAWIELRVPPMSVLLEMSTNLAAPVL